MKRCGLIAHWAKLVFLPLGERSELWTKVAPSGFLNGITMADGLRLRDFNGIIQSDSQPTWFNTATWEIFKLKTLRYFLKYSTSVAFSKISLRIIFIIVKLADDFFKSSINPFFLIKCKKIVEENADHSFLDLKRTSSYFCLNSPKAKHIKYTVM